MLVSDGMTARSTDSRRLAASAALKRSTPHISAQNTDRSTETMEISSVPETTASSLYICVRLGSSCSTGSTDAVWPAKIPRQPSASPPSSKESRLPALVNSNRRSFPVRSKVLYSVASHTGLSRIELLRSGTQDGSPSMGSECVWLLRPAK